MLLAGIVSRRCIITGVVTDSQQIEPIKDRAGVILVDPLSVVS